MTKADLVDEVAALWEKVRGLEAQLTAAASERDKARQAALTEAALVPRKFAENAQRERQVGRRYSDDYYVGVIDSCSNAATMIDLFGSESSEQIHDQIAAAAQDQALGEAEAACEAVAKEHVGPQDILAPPRRDYVYHEGQQVGAETCRDRIAALRTPAGEQKRGNSMKYEIGEDRIHSGHWRVEAIDHESEGECYVTIFSGPLARERASEYAGWKQGRTPAGEPGAEVKQQAAEAADEIEHWPDEEKPI